jgi:transcriptional regulator with XRE-family HTH domain
METSSHVARETNDHAETVLALGASVRTLRKRRGMTLDDLAATTGVSSSMVSLVERGKVSPSIATLLAIASGLGVSVSELFPALPVLDRQLVTRLDDQPVIEKSNGYTRRLLRLDRETQTEFSIVTFLPGAFNHKQRSAHRGYEYALLLEGELTVEFDATEYVLTRGDAMSFPSVSAHRTVNKGDTTAVAVWLNIGLI